MTSNTTTRTKYIVCLGDGMADEPIAALGNKTPLQAARTPNMDRVASLGQAGLVHTVPAGLHPGSDVANMGILGYDPRQYYTGRGAIEAAAMGIQVPPGYIIFRCNLVTITNDVMADFTAGHVSNEDGRALLEELNAALNPEAIFFPGVGYRNIVLLKESLLHLKTTAPHDILDQPVAAYLPTGDPVKNADENEYIREFMLRCRKRLAKSPVNEKRRASGHKPVTDIWPWSQGTIPTLESFQDKYNLTGGIITAVDLLRGLAVLTGLSAPIVPGATGFIDTDYKAKLDAGLALLDTGDFSYIHIEAPDECGHMGDFALKTKAIEDFDREIVGPVLDYAAGHPNTKILVLPDHPTPCRLKTHTNAPVPFAMCGPRIGKGSVTQYDEASVEASGIVFLTPWDLMAHFLDSSQ